MARTGQPAARRIAAVQRAVAVLEVLADADADLGTNEIARRAEINASSVSRLLATLAGAGLVDHVAESGRYRLGMRLFHLGNAAVARVDLRQLARPVLQGLAAASGETATLSIPHDHEALTVDFVQSPASVRSVARLGRPSVPHATAIGKVLLAHSATLPTGELTAFTDRTITDPATLAGELKRVASRGWAEARGEREPDLNAIAAPVRSQGELIAILGIQGPAGRFNRKAMRRAAPLLLEAAAAVAGRGRAGPASDS